MKIHTSIPFLFLVLMLALFSADGARAQYPVTDAGAQALLVQGNSNFLQQMATELAKLDTQITHLQNIETQGQQALTIMGNPAQAISFVSGSMGLQTSALTNSSLFKSIESITTAANGARSLVNTGGGIFQAVSTTTPGGLQVVHNADLYKKFDAFEQEFSNFQSILTQAQTQRQTLLIQLQAVMGSPASTQAEQSEKIARINALAAQLHANDEVIRDASEQRQAQQEANTQDTEKQSQAQQDELNTEFQQNQPQADQQADSALSSILTQKP